VQLQSETLVQRKNTLNKVVGFFQLNSFISPVNRAEYAFFSVGAV